MRIQIPDRMTVAEFQDWQPPVSLEERRWELVDGQPVCMAPPSVDHGAIQNEFGRILGNHLLATRPACRVITTPGVIPRVQSETNERVPDLAVTCSPARGSRTLADPVLLIEILSPSNEAKTRSNVWAYCTIPSAREILLLSSTAIKAEIIRRGADGNWPETPLLVGSEDLLRLDSIDFETRLRDLYATTSLVA